VSHSDHAIPRNGMGNEVLKKKEEKKRIKNKDPGYCGEI
jgi:hypothetical protein